jgi:hypothetical protein
MPANTAACAVGGDDEPRADLAGLTGQPIDERRIDVVVAHVEPA